MHRLIALLPWVKRRRLAVVELWEASHAACRSGDLHRMLEASRALSNAHCELSKTEWWQLVHLDLHRTDLATPEDAAIPCQLWMAAELRKLWHLPPVESASGPHSVQQAGKSSIGKDGAA